MNTTELTDFFVDAFPTMDAEQQRMALALYRLLATGNPVTVDQLHAASGVSRIKIEQTLQLWPGVFFDDAARVIGFLGISIEPMPHQMVAGKDTAFAWCAWDTLFIPQLLDQTVKVQSNCPVTGNPIALEVSPTGFETGDHAQILLSFLTPDPEKIRTDVTTNFCQYVYFFDSRAVAEQWISEHSGTFILSLEDAFLLGQAVNKARYHSTLQ